MDRRPRIGHAYVPRMGGGHLLQLSNDGPGDLDRVEVELLNPAQPYESGPRAISDDDALGRHGVSTTVSFGPWRLGETRRLLLWHNGPIRGVINLRCTCYLPRGQRAVAGLGGCPATARCLSQVLRIPRCMEITAVEHNVDRRHGVSVPAHAGRYAPVRRHRARSGGGSYGRPARPARRVPERAPQATTGGRVDASRAAPVIICGCATRAAPRSWRRRTWRTARPPGAGRSLVYGAPR
jgi:hypothetical protein